MEYSAREDPEAISDVPAPPSARGRVRARGRGRGRASAEWL